MLDLSRKTLPLACSSKTVTWSSRTKHSTHFAKSSTMRSGSHPHISQATCSDRTTKYKSWSTHSNRLRSRWPSIICRCTPCGRTTTISGPRSHPTPEDLRYPYTRDETLFDFEATCLYVSQSVAASLVAAMQNEFAEWEKCLCDFGDRR